MRSRRKVTGIRICNSRMVSPAAYSILKGTAWGQMVHQSWLPLQNSKSEPVACVARVRGRRTNQRARIEPIRLRKMARLGASFAGRTGDARKHAHALELFRFEGMRFHSKVEWVDFQASTPPWRKSVFNFLPSKFTEAEPYRVSEPGLSQQDGTTLVASCWMGCSQSP